MLYATKWDDSTFFLQATGFINNNQYRKANIILATVWGSGRFIFISSKNPYFLHDLLQKEFHGHYFAVFYAGVFGRHAMDLEVLRDEPKST